MKKMLILGFMLITLFLTGCNTENGPEFILISRDMSAVNYVEDTFIVIEDLDSFKTYFSKDQNEQDFEKINEETFSDCVLIYFEYVSHQAFKKEQFILNDVYKENQTLFFEITTPVVGSLAYVTQTLNYLVKVDRNIVKDIMNYQLTFGVYGEVH